MILNFKNIFRKILINYYQVVKLETGYRVSYLPFIFFILIISISIIFIIINIINEINNKIFFYRCECVKKYFSLNDINYCVYEMQ